LLSIRAKVGYRLMAFTQEQIKNALKSVKYPGFSRDIVSFGLVKEIVSAGGETRVQLVLTTNDPAVPRAIKADAENVLRGLGLPEPKVLIDIHAPPGGVGSSGVGATRIPGIKHIIAIASGKGGVGKSTVAANLAIALQNAGARVGICDCDIYGPSISLMFGSREQPMATEENRILPIEQYGLKLMSMGFLLDDSSPAILRGPMVTRYTQHRRYSTYHRPNRCSGGRDCRNHAARGGADRRAQGRNHVREGKRACDRPNRKHELLRFAERSAALRDFWKRRRRTRSKAIAGAVARTNPHRYCDAGSG
jgi:metal-sulfur cluster biosynthetic enzyme